MLRSEDCRRDDVERDGLNERKCKSSTSMPELSNLSLTTQSLIVRRLRLERDIELMKESCYIDVVGKRSRAQKQVATRPCCRGRSDRDDSVNSPTTYTLKSLI